MQKTLEYQIDGMDCGSCASKIETAVSRLAGVAEVSVSLVRRMMKLTLASGSEAEEQVVPLLNRLGYEAKLVTNQATDNSPAALKDTRDNDTCCSVAARQHSGHGKEDCGKGGRHDCDSHSNKDNCDAGDDGADHGCTGHKDHDCAGHKGDDCDAHGHHDCDSHGNHGDGDHDDHHGHDHTHDYDDSKAWWQQRNARLAFASGGALLVAYVIGLLYQPISNWAFLVAMLVGLVPVLRRAIADARAGVYFSIEMLMSLAAVGAVIIGSVEEAAMVILLFLIGELLESVTASRARASIRGLVDLIPKTAIRESASGGAQEEVLAKSLRIGDIIVVRPGDRIAADGEILSGSSAISEAPVTGESVPVEKTVADSVYAGTVNGDCVLRVRVTTTAADNTIARVIRLVEEAQDAKAPTARFIDRFARRYTPFVVLIAALTMLVPPLLFGAAWGGWIYKGLALLLIGCPCALVISTPTAIAAALSAGARRGLLMKGGIVLESAVKVKVIAFDKTGTLTAGTPRVTDVLGVGVSEAEVLRICAALETGSSHPLAAAVLASASEQGIAVEPASEASAIAGRGVLGSIGGKQYFLGSARGASEQAELTAGVAKDIDTLRHDGKTVSVLVAASGGAGKGQVVGVVAMRDDLRPSSAAAIGELHRMGVRTVMLTGDNERTAQAIATPLAMEVRAELMPQDKQRIVAELKSKARGEEKVAVVGDGINDAPALAAADIGIAMGGGTDVALETADAAILRSDISDIGAMLRLSRATMRNIYQNIAFALGFKGVFLVTTLLGITGLWPAILADTGASVIVTLNAMRLLRWKADANS